MSGRERRVVAVTGASGYIGSRLVPRLLAAGWRVRCLVRTPRKLEARAWVSDPGVEIVACDLADAGATRAALTGCIHAYYLVHSMLSAGAHYASVDQELAQSFASAAQSAGVQRILYLAGLGETGDDLSEHLRSRRRVEAALASGTVPVTVLRAAMIVGAGSASFEILRYLTERLPVMVTPRWVSSPCQPIAVDDVLHYLVACLDEPRTVGATLDIGGPDVLTYADLIGLLARARGLRRLVVPVPVLTPRLSSWWIHLVTPISAQIARPLTEGLRNRVVCRDERARQWMPHACMPMREAIEAALAADTKGHVESRWSDAGVQPGDPDWAGGTAFVDARQVTVAVAPDRVFRAVCRLGGRHGWYAMNWLWRLRGMIDRLVGGPGLRRGRRDPERISFGEALDFWRVTEVAADRCLELRAEMRLPGVATLRFDLEPGDVPGSTRLRQTARFRPRGVLGLAYWYAVLPLHALVFRGMLRGIARAAANGAVREVDSGTAA